VSFFGGRASLAGDLRRCARLCGVALPEHGARAARERKRSRTAAVGRPVFSRCVALAMVAVGALSMLFYLVFAAYRPISAADYDGAANAMSALRRGVCGAERFLRDSGKFRFHEPRPGREEMAGPALSLTPDTETQRKRSSRITTKDPKSSSAKWAQCQTLASRRGAENAVCAVVGDYHALAWTLSRMSVSNAEGSETERLPQWLDGTELATAAISIMANDFQPIGRGGLCHRRSEPFLVARLAGTRVYVLSDRIS